MMKNKLILLTLSFIIGLSACKKDKASEKTLEDGKSTVVKDLSGDTEAAIGSPIPGKEQRPFYTFLYRLSDGKQIWIRNAEDEARWLKTNEWDIAFTGPYNSEIYVNNGSQTGNPGFGGPGTGSAIMQERAYEDVSSAPASEAFIQSKVVKIGQLESANPWGWFNYNASSHIMQAIKNRTYILRLPGGKYAKLEMLSVYLGNPPAVTDLYWPAPYFTFRYFLQQDGSSNLNTK